MKRSPTIGILRIPFHNEIWDRNKIIIDDIFAFSVAHKIMDDDCEP